MTARLLLGDCLQLMKEMPSESFDSIVTDAPYGMSDPPDIAVVLRHWLPEDPRIVSAIVDLLRIRAAARAGGFWADIAEHTTAALLKLIAVVRDSRSAYKHGKGGFMGAAWDSFVPGPQVWSETLRVAKPGAHALVFASTRTVDLMGIACRLAGWEVRDTLHWCHWQGMAKGLDVSKAIDRMAGAEREVIGITARRVGPAATRKTAGLNGSSTFRENPDNPGNLLTAPATPDAAKWGGWNSQLKPAVEPILLLRKPLSESTIAQQVLATGTGALNIDACRIPDGSSVWPGPQGDPGVPQSNPLNRVGVVGSAMQATGSAERNQAAQRLSVERLRLLGRYPANLLHFSKPSRREKEAGCEGLPGLDCLETIQYNEAWVNEVLKAALPADMERSRRRAIDGSTAQMSADTAWSTCWCGSPCTDPFHPAITSIIETTTASTTTPPTWKRSTRSHTNGCMAAVFGVMMESGSSRVDSAARASPWMKSTGISPWRDGRSMASADRATSVRSWLTSGNDERGKAAKGGRGGVRNFHPT